MTEKALVVFSPLPPMQTGIADYSYELLGGLAEHRRCTVVVEDGARGLRAPEGVAVIFLAEYLRRATEFAPALHLYHLGNNPDHVYMLPVMAQTPGLIVLHDPGLHHLLDCATAARSDFAAYAAALAAEYGAPGRVLAQQYLHDRLREPGMIREMPMLTGLLGPAKGVIVHSRFAATKVLARVPHAAVSVVPHHCTPPLYPPRSRAAVRRELGVAAGEVMFLSVGFVTHTKCIDRALRALSEVAAALPPFRYVVAGEIRPGEPDIPLLARQCGLADHVLTKGFVSEEMFYDLIGAADVVINLRYPVGGETSGTLIRALGRGACTVVVDRGPFAEIPDGAAEKLAWGPDFDRRLAAVLLHLAGAPARRAQIGAAAARAMAQAHTLDHSVAGYLRAIGTAEARAAPSWRTQAEWAFPVPAARPQHGALWQRIGALPEPDPGVRALYVGPGAPPATGQLWARCELDRLPAGVAADADQDLILVEADAAAFAADNVGHLQRCCRMLRFGGLLIVNLTRTGFRPGESSRGTLEAAEAGRAALEASGFTVLDHATAPEPDLSDPAAEPTLQEEVCWRAAKTSAFLTRPDWRSL